MSRLSRLLSKSKQQPQPFQLLHLPSELILQILAYIPFPQILFYLSVSRAFNSLISLASLQYPIALQIHALTNNPSSTLSPAVSLTLLNAREHAWHFTPLFRRKVSLPQNHHSSWVQDLVDGVYLLGDTVTRQKVMAANASVIWATRAIRCRLLPSHRHHHTPWSYFDPGMAILNVALAIHPHDLIPIVTTQPDSLHFDHSLIQIHLLQFSTGNPHPDATLHPLTVTRTKSEARRPEVTITPLGHRLAILLAHGPCIPGVFDEFFLFDWKTGILILTFQFPHRTHHSFVFLTPHTLLFPNLTTGALDILHIPASPAPDGPCPPRIACSLALPPLKSAYYYHVIWARAEPKPTPDPDPHHPPPSAPARRPPFHAAPDHTLLLFHVGVQKRVVAEPWGTAGMRVYTLLVHRQSLLALVSPPLPGPAPALVVPWKAWGPPRTRWLDAHDVPTRLTNTSAGQRHVRLAPDGRIHVLDFNPWHVRWELARARRRGGGKGSSGDGDGDAGGGGEVRVVGGRGTLEHGGEANPWRGRVCSALPYVLSVSAARYPYCGVVMDEERIVGVQMNQAEDRITGVEVLHFG